MTAADRVAELKRTRPQDRILRGSFAFIVLAVAGVWFVRGFDVAPLFTERRRANVARFAEELKPFPLQGRDWDWGIALDWAGEVWSDATAHATWATVAIAVLAIAMAAVAAAPIACLAARNLAVPEPFVAGARPPGPLRRWSWRLGVLAVRVFLIVTRSIPEYLLAFFFVAIFGTSAWPAVLALAIHNFGILGRLGSETVEHARGRELEALRGLGAGRRALALHAILPATLPRYLLYVFYRWETCVREATVLGMLGFVSLGYLVEEARIRGHVDVMGFYILVGAAIVMAGDLVSVLLRGIVRRAR